MSAEPQIELIGIDKHYGHFHALKDINLTIGKGEFVALVGPSGCGKSTLLRSLAGLESMTGGTMKIDGDLMNGVPPRKRDVAMVFQSYALYPHMTVEENLTYSLRLRGIGKDVARRKAEEVAATIGLTSLLGRYPRALSGGQRQRVAMGRAIIRHPKAFLFDEPLSNLDAALRVHMRKEVRALHDRLGATSVYVTHDQIEAMTMADRIVVMQAGVIEQVGSPLELYDRPMNLFVAGFIGSPAMNFIRGTVGADGRSLLIEGGIAIATRPFASLLAGQKVVFGIRPEHVVLGGGEALAAEVVAVEPTGAQTHVTLRLGDAEVVCVAGERIVAAAGSQLPLDLSAAQTHVFDPASGARLDA